MPFERAGFRPNGLGGTDMDHDRKTQLKEKAAEELRLLLGISAYLAAVFFSFLTYRRLVSREFGVTSFHYGFAIVEALVVAKVILLGKAMGLGKRASGRARIWVALRSALVYGVLVAIFSVLEHLVDGLIHGKTLAASFDAVWNRGVYEILGRSLILFVALIPFFALWELDRAIGEGKVLSILFRQNPPQRVE